MVSLGGILRNIKQRRVIPLHKIMCTASHNAEVLLTHSRHRFVAICFVISFMEANITQQDWDCLLRLNVLNSDDVVRYTARSDDIIDAL